MSNVFRNLDLAALASTLNTTTANLQDFEMISPSVARVCISMSGAFPSRSEVRSAIASLFKGMASPVEASFRNLSESGGIKTVIGFVKASAEVRPFEEATNGRMKAMASNLLMDDTDKSMWEIRAGSTGKYLVKQGNEDLSELASLAVSRKVGLPSLAHVANVTAAKTEFAAFLDKKMEEVQFGFVVASTDDGLEVLPFDGDGDVETVTPEQLVQVVNLDGEDTQATGMEMSAAVMNDKSAMIEYYKKAYQHAPDYVAKVIEQINQHAFA